MIRIALLTTDSREHFHDYDRATPYFGSAPEALLEGFAALPEVEIHVISCLQRRIPSPEKLQANIFYHGLYVPKLGWMRTGYQGCVHAVRRRLEQIRPHLVHGQGTERDCALTAAMSGRPNLVTIHGHMRRIAEMVRARPFSYYWLVSRLEGWVLRRTEGVICITRYTQEVVRSRTRRTWLIPNAVSNEFFSGSTGGRQIRDDKEPSLVLCVGHVSPWKNQNWLMTTIDPLAQRRNLRLRFIGHVVPGDPYGMEFQQLLEGRPWCEHIGMADREAIRKNLDQADVLVLPSLEENCPMVVLEAMARGVPVVGTNVGGVSDLIRDNVTGRLIPSQQPEAFQSAVESLLQDPAARERLRERARQEAEQRFRPSVVARQHVDVYESIIDRRGGKPRTTS